MSEMEKKVHVRLYARCLVDGEIREKGTVVEVEESIADIFGERLDKKADTKKAKSDK